MAIDPDKRVIVVSPMVGICFMRVCVVDGVGDAEILDVCNRENPAGTTGGWSEVCHEDSEMLGKVGPIACEGEPGRTHYMVAC